MDLDLPPGVTARPPRRDDLPAMHALLSAYEQQLLGEPLIDLEDLEADWQRPSFVPERDAVLVHDDGRVAAYAEVSGGRRVNVCVHPERTGRGIGRALLDWSAGAVAAHGGDLAGQTVPDADTAAAALLAARGWSPRWSSWVLELPPGQAVAGRPLPPGYRLRAFRPGQDEQDAYRVVEDAFAEWPDRPPTPYEDWAAHVLGRPGFAPEQLLLVEDAQQQVVGACVLILSGDTGWVDQVAVDRAHRGRGLAQALLAAGFDVARARGASRSELSTDSRTGALGLYERLGMRVRWSFTHWGLELRQR